MLTIVPGSDNSVRFEGRLDAAQSDAALAALDRLGGTVVVDCAALDYISSAGLGVLLKTQKRLGPAGGRLRLVGVQPPVRDVLAYSGFDQLFDVVAAA